MLNWIVGNKELIKLIYGLVISLICVIIVLKTDKLFRLSMHQGIRYFRNAFFFYGLAFITRYLLEAIVSYNFLPIVYESSIKLMFEFFLITAGFFLIYSLLWKKIETTKENYRSSLLNKKIIVLYIMAFVLALLDYIWQAYYFMFFSQIIIFIFASVISYLNYTSNGEKHRFLKFYFIAMLLSLSAWVLNALSPIYFNWSQGVLMNIYVLNSILFLLFLWGVIKITKK